MRLVSLASLLAVVSLAFLVGVAGRPVSTVEAATFTMQGVATGAQEVPPVTTSTGSARVWFQFDDVANRLSYVVDVQGISVELVTAAHIHRGASGVNGPIVYNLSTTAFTHASGTINLTAADVADLKAGNFYFNAHSTQNPAGFARFQLVLPQPPAPPPAVSPPRTGDAGLLEGATGTSFATLAVLIAIGATGTLALARRRSQ